MHDVLGVIYRFRDLERRDLPFPTGSFTSDIFTSFSGSVLSVILIGGGLGITGGVGSIVIGMGVGSVIIGTNFAGKETGTETGKETGAKVGKEAGMEAGICSTNIDAGTGTCTGIGFVGAGATKGVGAGIDFVGAGATKGVGAGASTLRSTTTLGSPVNAFVSASKGFVIVFTSSFFFPQQSIYIYGHFRSIKKFEGQQPHDIIVYIKYKLECLLFLPSGRQLSNGLSRRPVMSGRCRSILERQPGLLLMR